MKRLKRFAAIGALTAVVSLSFGAGAATAAPNDNACTGQNVSLAARQAGGLGTQIPPQEIGAAIRALNEFCREEF